MARRIITVERTEKPAEPALCESCGDQISDRDVKAYREAANGADDHGYPAVCAGCADIEAADARTLRFVGGS